MGKSKDEQKSSDRGVAGEGEDDRTNISAADYDVEASIGHIMDLPKNDIGVELIRRTFEPTLIVSPGKEKVVAQLKRLASKADSCFSGARSRIAKARRLPRISADSIVADL